jgi:hypothetical protein
MLYGRDRRAGWGTRHTLRVFVIGGERRWSTLIDVAAKRREPQARPIVGRVEGGDRYELRHVEAQDVGNLEGDPSATKWCKSNAPVSSVSSGMR